MKGPPLERAPGRLRRSRSGPSLLAALLGAVPVWGAQEAPPAESTRRMAERLERLAQDLDSGVAAFGGSPVRDFEGREPPDDPGARIEYLARWGNALLFEGRSDEAVAKVEEALGALRSSPHSLPPGGEDSLLRLLAVAFLRLGEQENCLAHHNVDSCLLPIREGGVHRERRGGRRAMETYLELARRHPRDLEVRWLLNVSAMTIGEYPEGVPEPLRLPPGALESEARIDRFLDVAPRAGVADAGLSGGCVIEDLDGDGLLDVMTSSWGMRDPLRLYRNNGDGTFSERAREAGLAGLGGGLNLVHADYNDDGSADVLVLRGAWLGARGRHPNSLLRNRGDGTFDDATVAAGLDGEFPTQAAAWGDYDGDGRLDLYVGNEGTPELPCATQLFHNEGDGTFTERASQVGLAGRAYLKGVAWGDFDNDGAPDLYLSNLLGPNLLFRNEGPTAGGWAFREIGGPAGVRKPENSFPTWFWDYDNDGWLDLFAAAYPLSILKGGPNEVLAEYLELPTEVEPPRLYHNERNGTFRDVTAETGLRRVLYVMGANFGDIDNDGFPDAYLGTGAPPYAALMPNRMFRNAEGRAFEDVTTAGGFGHLQKGHAIGFGDLDEDGDQDVYAVMGGAYRGDGFPNALFENPGGPGRWVTLELEGARSNRSAIGARVRLEVETPEGPRAIHATVSTGGSFGSSSLRLETGLGAASRIRRLEVAWPSSGVHQVALDLPVDRTFRLREGGASPVPVERRRFRFTAPGEASRTGPAPPR